jgi:hypothetical protein
MIYRTYRGNVHSYEEGCRIARDLLLRRCVCVCVSVCVCVCLGKTPIISVRFVAEFFRRKLHNIDEFREVTKSLAHSPS